MHSGAHQNNMLSLGSSAQLGIGIAIKLQDQFSGTARTVASNLKGLKNAANDAVVSSMRNYRNNAAGIATATLGATYGMIKMAESAADFQHRINQVAIVGGKELGMARKDLSKFANDMAGLYGKTPTEIATAMFENAKAGITTNMKEITRYQVAVATAVGEQLEGPGGVAEKLIGIMNAYNMSSSQFKDVSNVMVSVANATISSVNDIGEAMEYAAFTAKNFNIPFEMTVAMIGKLSQAKIHGSSAGTGINNMLLQLAKSLGPLASPKSKKVWKLLGLDRGQMANMMNTGNMGGIIQALSQATAGMTPVNRTALLSDLFQRRGDRALEGIFNTQHGVSLDELYRGALRDKGKDIANVQSKQMMEDLAGAFKRFYSGFIIFKNTLVEGITPALKIFLGGLTHVAHLLTAIAKTTVGKVLFGLAAVIVPLIGIMFAFRAAALTAAIALNGFGMTAGAGGFRALMGAGLDMASSSYLARKGMSGVKFNKLGRAYVGAGQSVSFGGKVFGAGSILPNAFVASMGTSLNVGKGIAGGITKLVNGVFKFIPVIGAILTIASVAGFIWDWLKGDSAISRANNMKAQQEDSTSIRARFGDRFNPLELRAGNTAAGKAAEQRILQTINVNIDGKNAMSQTIEHQAEDNMNNQMNFNSIQ